jgi:hypothetical protein
MADTILDGSGEHIPGRRPLDGTDLEIAYALLGDDLILRVNKAGVQVCSGWCWRTLARR